MKEVALQIPDTASPGEKGGLAAALGLPVPPQLMRSQAFEAVRDAIISGRLAPGTRLIERELCAALGVSRTIVREVIRWLEAERLVQVTAHRGPRVAVLSAKTAREIYELRGELESLLVRGFVHNADDSQIRALRSLVQEVEAAARRDDIPELVAIMRRFYAVLLEGSDNSVVGETLESLHARISRLRVLSMSEPGRAARSVTEIAAIVEAIERRDPAAAERATRAYVSAARDSALNRIRLGEGDSPAGV